ncbi:NAD-dependent succinate-semialdehyde dehydrogenase [Cypionkella sp.]|uniref:NAD-dependent succinate-semialdehyde dehydrogenase n=1 Tax=Cypionkella sp. TaxID=2811411 RepID=UPI002617F3C5|nr:NAD-dependent succinate-semialdehyde dehydrogenase [Cypionkella sp.]MDB5664610.1 aldehyde dehydrogenase family protein [Cypionkella sp.]
MTQITSINPTTGEAIRSFDLQDDSAIESTLAAAAKAQKAWAQVPLSERVKTLPRIAAVLRENKTRYADMIVREMGKPITEAEAEIEKCAFTCDFYAEHAPIWLADEPIATNAFETAVVFDPLGVVLAIMPWNYPFWQYFRFAAPALAAGNGAILKHANNVPESALAVQEVMEKAGLTATLLIDNAKVANIIADLRIAAVTLTGSTEVGSIVAAQAGRALKKQVLELGGSDPFIVLADADLEAAADTAVKARYINVGQSCVNAKRFIVETSVADRFTELFIAKAAALKIGDPMQRDTKIGPMARLNLRATLHDQVQRSIAEGAILRLGGTPIDGPGAYYPPTVLDHVTPGMTAFREETFGPVAAIVRADNADHAITLASDSEYGLGCALWTTDLTRARVLSRRIEAGAVFINGMTASDPRYPFGGIKRSGYGRELGSYGIREFTNIKTVWIGPAT